MKYLVRTVFDGELTWEGEAESEEQAAKFADEAIGNMENADEYQRCSSFTGQTVEPWTEEGAREPGLLIVYRVAEVPTS